MLYLYSPPALFWFLFLIYSQVWVHPRQMFILNIYVTCILWGRRERKLPSKPSQGAAFCLVTFFPSCELLICCFTWEGFVSPESFPWCQLSEVRHYPRRCLAKKELVGCTWAGSFLHMFCTIPHCSASSQTACTPSTLITPWHSTRFRNNKELLPGADYLVGQMRHQKDFSTGEAPAAVLANKGRFSQP